MTAEIAARALALWPVAVQTLALAAQRENHVYRVTVADGRSLALRLHRPGYRSDAELTSELRWMETLRSGGLEVPAPLLSRRRRFIERVDGHQVDLLTWLDGAPLGKVGQPLMIADRQEVFRALGRGLALLHDISDRWQPPAEFTRPRWDVDGLTGPDPLWGRYWENPALAPAERDLLIAARDRARAALLRRADALDHGLIHADLVPENVLVSGTSVRMIDFDDSGFGFRLFDIATALIKNTAAPDYAALESALLAGYRERRAFDAALLPLFMMLRAFTYLGWIIPRLAEAGAKARNARNLAPALDLARRYVAGA